MESPNSRPPSTLLLISYLKSNKTDSVNIRYIPQENRRHFSVANIHCTVRKAEQELYARVPIRPLLRFLLQKCRR